MGDPREPTTRVIREALADGARRGDRLPAREGLPELREAIAALGAAPLRRRGSTRHARSSRRSARRRRSSASRRSSSTARPASDVVLVPEPGYPVLRARRAVRRRRASRVPLLEENGFLPDLDAVDEDTWRATALSGSATRTTRRARSRRSRSTRGSPRSRASTTSSLASDEAYTELWFDEPPASALAGRATARTSSSSTRSRSARR